MVKILSLDISSVSTGHCVIDNGLLLKSSLGTINPDSKKTYGERLEHLVEKLTRLLREYKPDKVIIEDIFRGPNINTFKTLAMFRGIVFYIVFRETGLNPICIMPTTARKLVKVKGITKEDGFNFVKRKYHLDDFEFDSHNDITDAVVLGLACHEMEKQGLSESDLKHKRKKQRKKKKK